jgi:bifunctional DNA-binding transcriptional regulator/antitoxin component of YhaV-PrlF toxin-antitoxin module
MSALYAGVMSRSGDLKVSARGQMSLPAQARHRWGLDEGGIVGYLDLGDAIVLVPGDLQQLRTALIGAITDEDWTDARRGFGDPDLATE